MSDPSHEITFHRIPGKPVMVCVIETPSRTIGVGYSASKAHRFDEDLARANALTGAQRHLARFVRLAAQRAAERAREDEQRARAAE